MHNVAGEKGRGSGESISFLWEKEASRGEKNELKIMARREGRRKKS